MEVYEPTLVALSQLYKDRGESWCPWFDDPTFRPNIFVNSIDAYWHAKYYEASDIMATI